ncbi:MAG: DnaB helicase C-terminal domain-containing protein [Planctomycetota bacterium]|nr:DnaB helicase C-terminal domain-containing protein [Planctomycetota bacterium]
MLHDALKRELQNIAEIPLACEGCGSHFDFSLRSNATIEETITMAQRKIDKIATRLTPLRHAAVTEEELRNAVKAYSRTLNEETKNGCVPMAYHELTNAIGGKVPLGTLITIGGLPGNAKTLLLIQSLLAAANAGLTSVIFSQEMGYNAIGERVADMLCKRSKTSYTEQELNRLADEYFDGLEGKVIFRQVANTGDAVAAEIARCKQKYNASVFALDYLQLLGGNTAKSYERVTYNASVIRAATSSNNVTMFLAAQLNRSVMGSIPPIPKKHHFRDSGQIEQDADVILMLRHPVKDSSVEDVAKFLEQTEFDCRPEEYFEIRIDKLRNRKLEGVKVVPAVLKGQPLQLSTIKYKPESTPEN